MYIIESERNGEPTYDMGTMLAIQVYASEHIFLDDDIIFPYRPTASVQVGRYQNTFKEVNQDYVEANDIPVVRRNTGGGAIYMDRNHANFCFLTKPEDNIDDNFKKIYDPAIRALEKLGCKNVKRHGRNDLEIEGQKVSGAAQMITHGRLYGGYSLLLDVDQEAMDQALTPSKKKMESKGIDSVRKRTTTIRQYLAPEYQNISTDDFSDFVLCELAGVDSLGEATNYRLTEEDWKGIDQLVEERYHNWDWNYGESPEYKYKTEARFDAGTIQLTLDIDNGRIQHIAIYGDFFGGGKDLSELEEALVGTRMRKDDLVDKLTELGVGDYISNLKPEELADAIVSV